MARPISDEAQDVSAIGAYLVQLNRHLVAGLRRRRAVLAEVEGQLRAAVADQVARGMAERDAEAVAIARFGLPAEAAARLGTDLAARVDRCLSTSWRRFDAWRAEHPWAGTTLTAAGVVPLLVGVAIGLSRVLAGSSVAGRPNHPPADPLVSWVLVAVLVTGTVVVVALRARSLRHRPEPGLRARTKAWKAEHRGLDALGRGAWPAFGSLSMWLSTGRASAAMVYLVATGNMVVFPLLSGPGRSDPVPTRPRRACLAPALPWLAIGFLAVPTMALLGRHAWLVGLMLPAATFFCLPATPGRALGRWARSHPFLDGALRAAPVAAVLTLLCFFGLSRSTAGLSTGVRTAIAAVVAVPILAFLTLARGLATRARLYRELERSLAASGR